MDTHDNFSIQYVIYKRKA
uniref:Uncharacterized protein n=1 Tax=Rhizophora mucronata TaxID=61149 RepID=A0A2P2QWE9_RHIMU